VTVLSPASDQSVTELPACRSARCWQRSAIAIVKMIDSSAIISAPAIA
jgi:hypothetical protein